MQVEVEHRPGSTVALTVTIAPEEVKARMEQLFQKYARRVTVPGFRPGKAPRKMVEDRVDQAALAQDAIESVINSSYKEVLREQQLEPLAQGEMEDMQTGEDLSVKYVVVIPVRPEVTLPPFEDLKVEHAATLVTDEQVDGEIDRWRDRTADLAETDEPIETGDYATVDYAMTLDGEPYPDGSTEGYPLEVGADKFFPELNEELLGKKQGETFTFETCYPADYSNADLAGKTVSYTVTVQSVRRRQRPEATDAWAALVTSGEIGTIAELRERLRERLEKMAADMDRDAIRNELMRQLLEQVTVELPEALIEDEYLALAEDLEHRLSHERMTLDDYVEMTHRSHEDIEQEQRVMARDVVRRSLVMQQIARQEKLAVTDEEVDAIAMMEGYARGDESPEKVRKNVKKLRKELEESGRLDRMISYLFREKVYTFLESKAQIHISGLPEAAPEVQGPAPEVQSPMPEADMAAAEVEAVVPEAKTPRRKKKATAETEEQPTPPAAEPEA